MENYTSNERAKIVEIFIRNNYSIVKTQREFKKFFDTRSAPCKNTIKRLYGKFSTTGYLGNKKRPEKPRPKRTEGSIQLVKDSMLNQPETSSRRRSAQLGMARTTLRRTIRTDLNLYPYRIQCVQRILPIHFDKRLVYAKKVIEHAAADDAFWRSIIMSDEAHFTLCGTVNRQNYRYYANSNPQLVFGKPLGTTKE